MRRLDGLLERGTLRRWERALDRADGLDPAALKALRSRARALSGQVNRVLHRADARLASAKAVASPLHTDWAWRPELWSGPVAPLGLAGPVSGSALGREAKVYHDCQAAAFSVGQRRGGTFGVALDVYHFTGSFLSLAVDLPDAAVAGLSERSLVRVTLDVASERPVGVYGRLNLRHGPNVAQVVRRLESGHATDLDLAAAGLGEAGISAAWVDLIFEDPGMNRILIEDLTMSRRPRAEM